MLSEDLASIEIQDHLHRPEEMSQIKPSHFERTSLLVDIHRFKVAEEDVS